MTLNQNRDGSINLPRRTRKFTYEVTANALPTGLIGRTDGTIGSADSTYTVIDGTKLLGGVTMQTGTPSSGTKTATMEGAEVDCTGAAFIRQRARFDTGAYAGIVGIYSESADAQKRMGYGKWTPGNQAVIGFSRKLSGSATFVNTWTSLMAGAKKYDISLLLDHAAGDLYCLEGEQVADVWPGAFAANYFTSLVPRFVIGISSSEAALGPATNAVLRSMELELYYQ